MTAERLLTTEDVARRLGVTKRTIYAYVSRGRLASRRHALGKESLFSEADVAAFAANRRRAAAEPEAPAIHTGITLISGGELFYRGHNVRHLAMAASFEAVVMLLATGRLEDDRIVPDPGLRALAEAVTAPLPADARLTDRLRVTVAATAAADRLRFDTTPAAVIARGRTILGTMVAALPVRVPPERHQETFAGDLWIRLTDRLPTPVTLGILNTALVLLADHDLAASTFAARVAASTRAHPYAVVQAGLAALEGPRHGAASDLAYALLSETMQTRDPVGAIAKRLRADGWVAGFGHPLYPDGDPRADVLLALLTGRTEPPTGWSEPNDSSEPPTGWSGRPGGWSGPSGDARPGRPASSADGGSDREAVLTAVAELTAAMAEHSGAAPTIDFALAAFALLNGMDADAGEAIFAVARTAGWIAHALEEYADEPSRFRPNGRYAGRRPPAENNN